MKKKEQLFRRSLLDTASGVGAAVIALGVVTPNVARGCACGCGVFDIGAIDMLPSGPGGMVYLNYDYQDQRHNWAGNGPAPTADNSDRDIRTSFITPSFQYFFNQSWGVEAELPIDHRYFKTDGGATGNQIVGLDWWSLGDMRLKVDYTGFSPDMSTGVSLGVKLPTGDFHHNDAYDDVDRDTQLGSGSTDLLIGGYHHGQIPGDFGLAWFGQALLDVPVFTQEGYRPGLELDASLGVYYTRLDIGRLKIMPLAQVIGSFRTADSGPFASGGIDDDPAAGVASGYQRVLLSPGIEFDLHPWRFYADVEIPIYQQMNGDQLTAKELFKCSVSYMF